MTTTTVPPRGAIYTRVSTGKQEQNFSPASQLEACRAYAQANGMTIVAEHFDAKSGSNLDRPGLDAIRELVRSSAVDVVIVYNADRLSRDAADSAVLREEFRTNRVTLHNLARGGKVTANANGRLFSGIEAEFASYERTQLLERTQRGRAAKVTGGALLNAKQPPFGYDSLDGGWCINEGQAATVRTIFNWYADGVGSNTIAAQLDAQGTPTPTAQRHYHLHNAKNPKQRKYAGWALATISKILRTEAYAGTHRTTIAAGEDDLGFPTTVTAEIKVPAIIDADLWARVARRRGENAKLAKRNGRRVYLLRGMLTCWCGRAMSGMTKPAGSSYRCSSQRCYPTIRSEALDQAIWNYFLQVTTEEQIRDYYAACRQNERPRTEQLERDRAAYVRQLDQAAIAKQRLVAAVGAGLLEVEEIASEKAVIDGRRKDAQAKIDAIDAKLAALDHSVEKEEDSVTKAREIRQRLAGGLSPQGRQDALRSMDTEGTLHRDESGRYAMVTIDGLAAKRFDL